MTTTRTITSLVQFVTTYRGLWIALKENQLGIALCASAGLLRCITNLTAQQHQPSAATVVVG